MNNPIATLICLIAVGRNARTDNFITAEAALGKAHTATHCLAARADLLAMMGAR